MLRTLIAFSVFILAASAQQVRVTGTVASVDASAKTLVMKMDAGPELTVHFTRAAPQLGQYVVVNGRIADDGKSVEAVDLTTNARKSCGDQPIHAALADMKKPGPCVQPSPSHTD